MGCCLKSRTLSPTKSISSPPAPAMAPARSDSDSNTKHELLLTIPGCKVHLMDAGEALDLASGEFQVFRISDGDISLATVLKVGDELQWPLTKDEPVVKLDAYHYLFSLPMKDETPLSYGVTYSYKANLEVLDSFLKENSLFTCSMKKERKGDVDWKKFAPAVDDYNSVLARAIAGGTGQIVKGIFKCSNAYANQVQKGGEDILIRVIEDKNLGEAKGGQSNNNNGAHKSKSSISKSLKRIKQLSKMTEKLSKAMLNVAGATSGSVMWPVVQSQAGKKFISMVPGEVLLASLDAVNKILDAAEAAEKQAYTATSGAVTRMVSNRYGEGAAEATEDALATVGHVAGTAWNVVKLRKAINPASSVGVKSVLKSK